MTKILLFIVGLLFVTTSCNDDNNTDPPENTDPTFTATVEGAGVLLTDFNFTQEDFVSDFERGVTFFDDEEATEEDIIYGVSAVVEQDTMVILATSIDDTTVDTSYMLFQLQLKPGVVGTYQIETFDENILGGIFGEEPEEEIEPFEAIALYLSTKLPDEILFLYLFGAVSVSSDSTIEITEYDTTNQTISGNFSYTLRATDDEDVTTDIIKVKGGSFSKVSYIN